MSCKGILMSTKKYQIQSRQAFRSSIVLVVVALIFNSSNLFAEIDKTGLYSGALFSSSTFEVTPNSGSSVSTGWGHAKAKIGKFMNDKFAWEAQLGFTTNTSSSKGNLTYGAYARYDYPFGQYKLYGLLGFGGLFSFEDGTDDVSESSLSYGVGLEIYGSKDIAITFEYLSMLDTSVDNTDLTFDAVGLGFNFYFTEDTSYFNKNRNKVRSIRY